jgi:hypothetical protein
MPSPKESQQNASPDVSTAVQMDISVQECSRPSTKCRECNWSRGDHKKTCSKFRKIRAVEQETPKREGKRQGNLNGLGVPVAKVSCEYNSLNYHSQVGSPIELELGRGSKPVLDSASTHTSRKIPDNARIRSFNHRDITLTIEISPVRHAQRFMKMKALLDSGANAIYIDKAYAQKMKLPLTLLADPIPVYNVDGTRNAAGSITHCAEIIIQFQEHRERVTAEVTDLGKESNDSQLYVAFAS